MHVYLFYFINWDGRRCWWTDFVPEAIHNPEAIKLKAVGTIFGLGGQKKKIPKPHWYETPLVRSTISPKPQ